MPPHGVVVAEEGNKRQGSMSPAEMRQCVNDLVSWFEKRAKRDAVGATDKQLEGMCCSQKVTLPLALEELYLRSNGGLIWFDDKRMLSLEEAAKLKGEIKGEQYYPFGNDGEEDLLVVDSDTEAVFEYDLHNGLGQKVSGSFTDFLEQYRNELLADHFAFIEDMGVVEKVGIVHPPRGK